MVIREFISIMLGVSWLIFSATGVAAQEKQGANWFFGEKFHVDFNPNKPVAKTFVFAAADTLYRGVASVSDKNGNLLFFSYGGVVGSREKINGIYQPMPNGSFFKGANTNLTFNEMIVQSPADSNIYYLTFTGYQYINNAPEVNLYKLEIDMRLNRGYGDVVPNSLQLLRKTVGAEQLTAMLHQNNRDTWVVATNHARDSLLAILLTPNGFMLPVATKFPARIYGNSRMKASPNSEMIAVYAVDLVQGTGIEALQVFDFNRTTGIPTLRYSLFSPDLYLPFYSYAFSPDNTKLYAGAGSYTGFTNNAVVFQFDLKAGNATQVQQSRNEIYNTTASYQVHDLQLAIDGKIYLIIDSTSLGQISCPNFYGAACRFKQVGINLNGKSKGIRLPTLNQTIFRNADKLQAQATLNVICEGDTVQLSAFGAGAEQFKWEVANGLTAPSDTLANPFVSPTVTTTYKVIGYSDCISDTAYVRVNVLPKIPGVKVNGPLQVTSLTNRHEYAVQNPASGSVFNWQVVGGTIESGQGTTRIKVNWGTAGEGEISVFEDRETGCNGETISLKVKIAEAPEPVIYNVFTPNNDNKNDAFVIENLPWYAENELKIYNRWGVEVYKTSNYQNTWKAENVSAGVYYYLFKSNGRNWKGWVEVVK